MKKTFTAALLTAALAFSTTASATAINLDGSFGSTLSNGHYGANFSGAPSVPNGYTVNSLSFSFTFADNGGTFTNAAPVVDKYKASHYAWVGGIFDSHYHRNVDIAQTVKRSSEQETATLSFGDIVLGSGATQLTTSHDVKSSYEKVVDSHLCLFVFCKTKWSKTTTKTTTLTEDYTGGFTIAGIVSDQSIIDALLRDGQFMLNLSVGGNLLLTNAQVLLDYTALEAPVDVPEPSSILLAGLGLAAIGVARRRRARA